MKCPRCGFENPQGFAFCGNCGSPLGGPAAAPRALREERKVVTILFADITGSTTLGEQLDPEQTRAIMARFFEAMAAIVHDFGGTVEKFIGDEIMAVFGLPAAHEDDPERAVRAAAAMQARLGTLNEEFRLPERAALQMRIGINTGEVVANPDAAAKGEFMVTGDAVNVGARLRSAAAPGETIVGEQTYRRTQQIGEFREHGLLTLKGKAAAVRGWSLLGLRTEPVARRPGLRASLVGRDREIALLRSVLGRVIQERRPHLVSLLGAPGVGKTRLLEELVAAHPELTVRQGRSLPYGVTSLWPIGEIIRADCGILRSDAPAVVSDKLKARLSELFDATGSSEREAVFEQLSRVLAVSGHGDSVSLEGARDELFWALRRFLEAQAVRGPLFLVFEDAHSADTELLDLIEHLAGVAAGPILLACLARPELLERRPAWGGERNYSSLLLEPLPEADTSALIERLLSSVQVPPQVQAAVSVAGGNPLFVEEILRMLIDRRVLVRRDGGWEVAGPVTAAVPDSVQGVITARLDQLGRDEKSAVLDAAVLGKDFWLGALEALSGRSAETLDPLLVVLSAKDFITQRAVSRLAGQREFTFKHMLIHDVAYSVLPKSARAEKHRTFGVWLERTLGERAEEFADLLAHHWLQAVRLAEEVGAPAGGSAGKAVHYALLAGRRAARVYANEQALTHFQTAQALAASLGADTERIAAIEGQADVYALQASWDEASRLYQDALDYHLRQGDVVGQAKVQSRMASTFSGIYDFRQALPHIRSALGKLSSTTEPELAGLYAQMARTQTYLGNLAEAERYARAGLEAAERHGLRAVTAEAHGMIGLVKMATGDQAAGAYVEKYLAVAEELGDVRQAMLAHGQIAFWHRIRGEHEQSLTHYRRAVDLARHSGNRARVAGYLARAGSIELQRGRWAEARGYLKEYLEHTPDVTSWLEQVRSELAFLVGDLAEALSWAERAVRHTELRSDVFAHGLAIDWHILLCLRLGRGHEAAEAAANALAYFTPMRVLWPAYLHPLAAEAALLEGRGSDAAEHCRLAETYRWMDLRPALARLAGAQGMVAAAERRWGDAATRLREADTLFATLGQPYDRAQVLERLAAVLGEQSDSVGRAAALNLAGDLYRQIGAGFELDRLGATS